MKIVYCDLDGVLFDFNKKLNQIFSGVIPTNMDTLWSVLSQHPNLYRHLELYEGALDFWQSLNHLSLGYGFDICILTAIPRHSTMPLAAEDKQAAVIEHFGNVDFKVGPYAKDKKYHARSHDILIDDKLQNITDWVSKDGLAIHHLDFDQTLFKLKRILNNA